MSTPSPSPLEGTPRDLIQITSLALRTPLLEEDLWQRPKKGQPLFVSLKIETDVETEASTDSLLGTSLNYGTVTKTIEKAVAELASPSASTSSSDSELPIEEIAERLAAVILYKANAPNVRLEVTRPRALLTAESVGVEIYRTRSDYILSESFDSNESVLPSLNRSAPSLREDKLFIRALRRFIIIGINPCERIDEQEVIVDLEFYANQELGMATRLANGARNEWRAWRQVVKRVEESLSASQPLTIEHITTSLAQLIVTPPTHANSSLPDTWNVPRATVRISKPSALMFAKYPSVQVTRNRKDFYNPNGTLRTPASRGFATNDASSSVGTSATADSSASQSTSATETHQGRHRVILGVGTNLGERVGNISRALKELERIGSAGDEKTRVSATSFLYESEAMYVQDQAKFLNTTVEIETTLQPLALLQILKSVESSLGRRKTIRNGPRVIDLDILFYDDVVFDSRGLQSSAKDDEKWLKIPHASIAEREFVLRPLLDLDPHLRHPSSGRTATELFHSLLTDSTSTLNRVLPLTASLVSPLPFDKTLIMSIINTTPDSFSDGGDNLSLAQSVSTALSHIKAGADILDIGGMSTRPGAADISPEQEASRVVPLIKALRQKGVTIPISIDTFRAEVAKKAIEAGADIVNDVLGGAGQNMLRTLVELDVPVILMHSRGSPQTMSNLVDYENGDVVTGLKKELAQRVRGALDAGVKKWNIIIDPGIGFAKTGNDNLVLLRRLPEVLGRAGHDEDSALLGQFPSLVGLSRKKFIGTLTGQEVAKDRILGTAAGVTASIAGGADIVRVHDVAEMRDVVKVADGIYRL